MSNYLEKDVETRGIHGPTCLASTGTLSFIGKLSRCSFVVCAMLPLNSLYSIFKTNLLERRIVGMTPDLSIGSMLDETAPAGFIIKMY